MYTVKIKDHIMIAHSLPDPFFGPAQHMHGATYVVNVTFISEALTDKNVVLDIGEATEITKSALSGLAYQNLDELPQFKGKLTTTEFLAAYIHEQIRIKLDQPMRIRVELEESHIASAGFEA